MTWQQSEIRLRPRPRGFHLVTAEILDQIPAIQAYGLGLLHLFIMHTSAALALNENADPSVRRDVEAYFRRTVPDNAPYFTHTYEGPDDMPAHIKALMLGASLSLPIHQGRLRLGTWQGIYLCEHRERGGVRRLVATLQGQTGALSG